MILKVSTISNATINKKELPDDKIAVFLSQEDIKLFKDFQEHYDNFKILIESGIFNLRAKTVNLHIDPDGNIKNIDVLIKLVK
jgi:hypothetical protein